MSLTAKQGLIDGGSLTPKQSLVGNTNIAQILKGDKGDKGDRGEPFLYEHFTEEQLKALIGPQGPIGETGPQGEQGIQGVKGDKGDPGVDGKTPVKGVDYYTPEDQEALAADILERVRAQVKPAKIGNVTLLASAWTGSGNLYSQVVEVEGMTDRSQVDLTPDVEQLAVFYEKDITFVTENEDGVLTVYAIGQVPTNDYTIQVTITEVDV